MQEFHPTSDTSTTYLCPLNDRRSAKQVWMNLFTVHLTTIAAFCHVLSIRRERLWSWKLLAYVLMPATFLAAHAVAVIWLTTLALLWLVFSRTLRSRKRIARASLFFLASAPVADDPVEPEESEPLLKSCGRFVLACAFFVQCSGTLALFQRRQNHDAVTWADIRIAEAAAAGILVSAYWVLITARVPLFVQSVPTELPEDSTNLDLFVLTLRGSPSEELAERINIWLQRAIRFLGNYYLCVTILIIKAVWLWQEPPPEDNTWIFHNLTIQWINFLTPGMLPSISYGFVGWGVLREICFTAKPDTYPSRRLPKKWIVMRGWYIVMMLFAIKVPFFLWYVFTEWLQIATQLQQLELSPLNQSCPLLWSDPASNWIWTLS